MHDVAPARENSTPTLTGSVLATCVASLFARCFGHLQSSVRPCQRQVARTHRCGVLLGVGRRRKIRPFPLDMSFGRPLRLRNQFSLRPPKASAGSTATKPDRTQVRSGFLILFVRRLAELDSPHTEGMDRVPFSVVRRPRRASVSFHRPMRSSCHERHFQA